MMSRIVQDSDDEGDPISPVLSPVHNRSIDVPEDLAHGQRPKLKRRKLSNGLDQSSANVSTKSQAKNTVRPSSEPVDVTNRFALRGDDETVAYGDNNQIEWNLSPTIKEDFIKHGPITMFSENVSTVPDDPMLIELVGAQPASISDHNPPTQAKSSIPWSEIMNLPKEECIEIPNKSPQDIQSGEVKANQQNQMPDEKSQKDTTDSPEEIMKAIGGETYTPPGTPVIPQGTESRSSKRKSSNSKSKRKSKRIKKSRVEDPTMSEDELAMTNDDSVHPQTNARQLATSTEPTVEVDEMDSAFAESTEGQATISTKSEGSSNAIAMITVAKGCIDDEALKDDLELNEQTKLPSSKKEVNTDSSVNEASITKAKRGRGRPRKLQTNQETNITDMSPINNDSEESNIPKTSHSVTQPMQEISGNVPSFEVEEKLQHAEIERLESLPVDSNEKENQLLNKSARLNNSDKSSPQSSRRTPYRVGLSRRARIAPLLKSVRK
jgi:hypothetical protein